MPTYEYSCQDTCCSHQWEELQNISEEAIKTCPLCKKDTAQRLISGSNFILVGGGWAASGYSNK